MLLPEKVCHGTRHIEPEKQTKTLERNNEAAGQQSLISSTKGDDTIMQQAGFAKYFCLKKALTERKK